MKSVSIRRDKLRVRLIKLKFTLNCKGKVNNLPKMLILMPMRKGNMFFAVGWQG